jgi:hypothetical protein
LRLNCFTPSFSVSRPRAPSSKPKRSQAKTVDVRNPQTWRPWPDWRRAIVQVELALIGANPSITPLAKRLVLEAQADRVWKELYKRDAAGRFLYPARVHSISVWDNHFHPDTDFPLDDQAKAIGLLYLRVLAISQLKDGLLASPPTRAEVRRELSKAKRRALLIRAEAMRVDSAIWQPYPPEDLAKHKRALDDYASFLDANGEEGEIIRTIAVGRRRGNLAARSFARLISLHIQSLFHCKETGLYGTVANLTSISLDIKVTRFAVRDWLYDRETNANAKS